MRLKLGFWPKNARRLCFGVFRYAVEQFGILLCHTKDTQNHKISAQLDAQGVAAIKKAIVRQKVRVGPKTTSKRFFLVFQVCSETLRKLTAWIRWGWNLRDRRLNGSARCCNNKKSNFIEEQIAFHSKTFSKNGFLEFSDVAPLKPLLFLL